MKNKVLIVGLMGMFTFSFALNSQAQQQKPVKKKIGVVQVKKPVQEFKKSEKKVEFEPAMKVKLHSKHAVTKARNREAVQAKQRFRKPARCKK